MRVGDLDEMERSTLLFVLKVDTGLSGKVVVDVNVQSHDGAK